MKTTYPEFKLMTYREVCQCINLGEVNLPSIKPEYRGEFEARLKALKAYRDELRKEVR